jgi:anti-sigma B factor antagonist
MEIVVSDFGTIAKRVTLDGKLDIAGAEKLELPLAAVAGTKTNIVVDMTGVDFISSLGIRHLVLAAKTVGRSSCRLILLDPKPEVTEALVTAGLTDLLPIVRSEDDARAAFAPSAA